MAWQFARTPETAAETCFPRDYAAALLGGLDDEVAGKVLHDNAAKLYRLS